LRLRRGSPLGLKGKVEIKYKACWGEVRGGSTGGGKPAWSCLELGREGNEGGRGSSVNLPGTLGETKTHQGHEELHMLKPGPWKK